MGEGRVRCSASALASKCGTEKNPVNASVDCCSEDQFLKGDQLLPESFLRRRGRSGTKSRSE